MVASNERANNSYVKLQDNLKNTNKEILFVSQFELYSPEGLFWKGSEIKRNYFTKRKNWENREYEGFSREICQICQGVWRNFQYLF